MITGKKAPGRPHYVADIPFESDRELALLDEFGSVAKRLCYREIVGLARALNISERTVYAWHYGERFPRYGIMLDVIEWAKNGRPLRREYQKPPFHSML